MSPGTRSPDKTSRTPNTTHRGRARPFALLVVALFWFGGFGGVPASIAQTPGPAFADDLDRLTSCHGIEDQCLIDAFFEDDDQTQTHTWNHTLYALPPGLTSSMMGHDNAFLLSLDQGTLVGHLDLDDRTHIIHGGTITPEQSDGTQWFHAAMTWHDGTWRLYRDGDLVAERTGLQGTPDLDAATIFWGRLDHPDSRHFAGGIGDVRAYERALTQTEIQQAKTKGQGDFLADLTNSLLDDAEGGWTLNEGQGTTIPDHAGSADAHSIDVLPVWDHATRGIVTTEPG